MAMPPATIRWYIIVDHPENESPHRPGHEEDERRLAHPVGSVEHDHRVHCKQSCDGEAVPPGRPRSIPMDRIWTTAPAMKSADMMLAENARTDNAGHSGLRAIIGS